MSTHLASGIVGLTPCPQLSAVDKRPDDARQLPRKLARPLAVQLTTMR
jgi:hypothetical protein